MDFNEIHYNMILYKVKTKQKIITMENNSNNIVCNDSRKLAMGWWNSMVSGQKTQICDTNTELIGKIRRWETLTGREIEMLWKKEHPNLVTSAEQLDEIMDEIFSKPIKKKFNVDLFKAYINKFSDDDKCVALVTLLDSLDVKNDAQLAIKLANGHKIINGW